MVQVSYFNNVKEQERNRTDLGVIQQLQLFIIISFRIRVYNVPESVYCVSTNLTSKLNNHRYMSLRNAIPAVQFVSRNKRFLFNSQALHNCLVYVTLPVILVSP